MHLELALVADAVNLSESGKLNILGEFTQILCSSFPALHRSLSMAARFAGGPSDLGEHEVSLVFVDPSGKSRPIGSTRLTLEGTPRVEIPARMTLILTIEGVLLEVEGAYRFDLVVDGKLLGSIPLHAVLQAG